MFDTNIFQESVPPKLNTLETWLLPLKFHKKKKTAHIRIIIYVHIRLACVRDPRTPVKLFPIECFKCKINVGTFCTLRFQKDIRTVLFSRSDDVGISLCRRVIHYLLTYWPKLLSRISSSERNDRIVLAVYDDTKLPFIFILFSFLSFHFLFFFFFFAVEPKNFETNVP